MDVPGLTSLLAAFVYQEYFDLPLYDGQQSERLITRNESPFVPHILEDR